ncbi:hypothetical protein BsWGS_28594 [Bradybaena similaris]
MDLQDTGGDKKSPRWSSDDGVVSRDNTRLRQKLKWRWHWKKKENQPPQVTQFSHDPPGHTCGLPCCIQDNEPQQVLQRKSQTGCMTVPILSQADLSDSNFFMKRKQNPSEIGADKVRLRKSADCGDYQALGSDKDTQKHEHTPRHIRLSNSSDAIPSAGMIGQRSDVFVNKKCDWPHQKDQPLPPAEQIRQRHITLPDCPQTQHTIMFLSHQPGETSDFPEIRQSNTQVSNHQLAHDFTDNPQSHVNVKVKTFNGDEVLSLKIQSGPISPDEGYDKGDCFQDTLHKRRLVHSKLPEVPIESTDSGLAFEEEFKRVSPELEDSDLEDNLSVYVDHVYDVLNVVKDSASRLSPNSPCGQPVSASDFLSPSSASDFRQPKSPVLHRSISELTLSEIDSPAFPLPVEDNDSSVYNGSLLSFATNDSDISLLYPSVIARNRYLMGHFHYPTSLLRRQFFGSKLDQLSLSSTEKNEKEGASQEPDNVSIASTTNESDAQAHGEDNWVDLGLPKPTIKVDEYDMSGRLPSRSRFGIGASVSSEFDLDSNTKLKLWDLRLSTTGRDNNDYSTFPLRKFTTDDVNLGYFPSSHDFPYDQSNDDTIDKMTNNLMPSSVLSNNISRDNTALYFLNQGPTSSIPSSHPTVGKPISSLDEWKQLFDASRDSTEDSGSVPETSKSTRSRMPASWVFDWREEPEHEPIVFSGISELFKSRQAAQSCTDSLNSSSKCLEYPKHDSHLAQMQLSANGSSTPNPTIAFDPENSIYASYTYFGGSVYGSTSSFGSFAKRTTACGSRCSGSKEDNFGGSGTPQSGRSEGPRQSPSLPLARTGSSPANETVIMTRGNIVDWRRQAEFYRDNNYITLIL